PGAESGIAAHRRNTGPEMTARRTTSFQPIHENPQSRDRPVHVDGRDAPCCAACRQQNADNANKNGSPRPIYVQPVEKTFILLLDTARPTRPPPGASCIRPKSPAALFCRPL